MGEGRRFWEGEDEMKAAHGWALSSLALFRPPHCPLKLTQMISFMKNSLLLLGLGDSKKRVKH